MRQDKGAQTFSVLRHIAVNLLRRERRHKRGIQARRKRAGWDQEFYLLQVLAGSSLPIFEERRIISGGYLNSCTIM